MRVIILNMLKPKRIFMNNRERAEEIIKQYVLYSLGAGLVPIPFLNIAAVTTVQVAMLKKLTSLYNVKFSDNTLKVLVTSLLGSSGTQFGGGVIRNLPFLGGFIGSLAIPVLSGAVTYLVGQIFVEHFEHGGTLEDFDLEKGKQLFKAKFEEALEKVKELQKQYLGENTEEAVETVSPVNDPYVKLERLHELKKKGIISEEEFEAKKQELLKEL